MIDFTDQVAIVTGAGRGLGRLYALELARRGASVVVNDLGGTMHGEGADTTVADEVVAEIEGAGGGAVASHDSVASPEGGEAIVAVAVFIGAIAFFRKPPAPLPVVPPAVASHAQPPSPVEETAEIPPEAPRLRRSHFAADHDRQRTTAIRCVSVAPPKREGHAHMRCAPGADGRQDTVGMSMLSAQTMTASAASATMQS